MSDVALAIKVTSDAKSATDGLAETKSSLDSVNAAADATASVAGQSARAIGGLAKGFKLIGADGVADHLKEAQQALGFVKGAMQSVSLVTEGYTAVQTALNFVLAANPLLLVVLAVVALIAVLVLAYKKSETFRDIVDAAFRGIAKVVSFVVDFIRDHWKLLFVILTGPVGLAVLLIAKHWDEIKAGGAAVVDWVRDHFGAVKAAITKPFSDAKATIGDVWDHITGVISTAKETISTAMSGVKSAVQTVIDAFQSVIDKIQSVIDKVKSLKDIGGDLLSHVGLGRTSAGGTASGGFLAGTSLPSKGPESARSVEYHFHAPGGYIGDEVTLMRKFREMVADDLARFGPRPATP